MHAHTADAAPEFEAELAAYARRWPEEAATVGLFLELRCLTVQADQVSSQEAAGIPRLHHIRSMSREQPHGDGHGIRIARGSLGPCAKLDGPLVATVPLRVAGS